MNFHVLLLFNYIILKIMGLGPEEFPIRSTEDKSLLYFIPQNDFFVHYKIYRHLVFKILVSVSLKYQTVFQVSVMVSYHFISNLGMCP